jgi:hypothetical protein
LKLALPNIHFQSAPAAVGLYFRALDPHVRYIVVEHSEIVRKGGRSRCANKHQVIICPRMVGAAAPSPAMQVADEEIKENPADPDPRVRPWVESAPGVSHASQGHFQSHP